MKKSLLMLLSIVCVSFFFANCGDDPVTPTPTPTPTPTYRDVSYMVAFNDSLFQFVDISFKFLHKDKSMSHDTVTVPVSAMTLIEDPTKEKEWSRKIRVLRDSARIEIMDTTFHFYAYTFTHILVGDVLECTDFIGTVKKERPNVPDFTILLSRSWPSKYDSDIPDFRSYHSGVMNVDTAINTIFRIASKSFKSSYTVK